MNQVNTRNNLNGIFAVYLLGLLLGGLYVGMVAPVRLVIQQDFGLVDTTGIWMINIYTLFYAALIPVIGKLADISGRKPIFMGCLASFAVGSMMCGVSQVAGGFLLLLAGRIVQAVGACGIIPVANAEIGASFPTEKRGMALGIAAAVAGVSNVLGSAVGSVILGFTGNENWPALFYVAIPACVLLIAAAAFLLPNRMTETKGKLDIPGSVLFVVFVLLLLLCLQRIDFFDLAGSVAQTGTLVPLVGALAALVVFLLVERRVEDPVFHLEYLGNMRIVITMVVSFFVGCIVISMTLIPEVAEFVTDSPVGSGGIYVLPVGVLSMIGPPVGGKLIDKFGAKPVMLFGLVVSVVGYAFLALISVPTHSPILLIIGLSIMGLGMGFTMGAPTNYMILENTDPSESSAAIATIALVRQMGTTLAPAILLGFVVANPGVIGFQQMLLCVAFFCGLSILCMLFYKKKER